MSIPRRFIVVAEVNLRSTKVYVFSLLLPLESFSSHMLYLGSSCPSTHYLCLHISKNISLSVSVWPRLALLNLGSS